MGMTTFKYSAGGDATAAGWRHVGPLLLTVLLLLWLFRETAAAMVGVWARSDTFAHAFLVAPISAWLAWRRRAELTRAPVEPALIWLVPFGLSSLLWLLGELAGVNAATQGAFVAMIVCAVPAVLGNHIGRIVAFPLLFLFFSVPVGEFMIEPMMAWTADFTVAALRLTGVPVYREGLQFVIPSGNWSVIAGCSGVRYLIASLMVGTLFAYLNFYSPRRRLAFVLVAIAVPILANWLRAYLIVLVGHLSSNKIAAGADHLIYGWVFFGVVIMLMFMVGASFVDAPRAAAKAEQHVGTRSMTPCRVTPWLAAVAATAMVAATQYLHSRLDDVGPGSAVRLMLPERLPDPSGSATGWTASRDLLTTWVPAYRHAAQTVHAYYQPQPRPNTQGDGDAVGVWIGFYRDQGNERKMVTSTNTLVDERSPWLELVQPAAHVALTRGGEDVTVRAALLRTPSDPKVRPTQRLLVWGVYRVAGRYVSSDALAKMWLVGQRLAGLGDDSAILIFYTPTGDDDRGADRLRRFLADQLPMLAAQVDAAVGGTGSLR